MDANSSGEDCCVKVAVHVRPLLGDEKIQGCKDCVTIVAGKPQVQIGTHSFTFDHVYGSTGSPSTAMYEECVAPLVDGLFQGYNATVLAYGQTGSGKTYTMGTSLKDGCQTGLIPKVMNALFSKIETLKHEIEFQLHVSFIEIHKEEVRDLLDPDSANKPEIANGHAGKLTVPGKPPIQIRETSNGVITLAGSTERSVKMLKEMANCLEQGSLSRATGSTNMNSQSSRSHAIFTITMEQMRRLHPGTSSDGNLNDCMTEEYLCAKLHLVDLAGSERAKRTGSDGLRFKEGVHINKGLLALGNVISALGDEKKRKEGVHVPYRDSKLTRLLQDSLGGNSRTVMIACISPADINAEETLNTLKYANRARNIQNKPVINRDPMSNEMLKMRQQLEYLQAELCARGGGVSFDEIQVLRDRIAWLEATNEELCRELNEFRKRGGAIEPHEVTSKVGGIGATKSEGLKRGLQSMESCDYQMSESSDSGDIDEDTAKELEHTYLQNSMDKELNELNRQLEKKESEMKLFGGYDTTALKQHFGKKIMELEEEKRTVQRERDKLLAEIENLSANSDGHAQKVQDAHSQKLKLLEAQIQDLKKKEENQVQLLKQKQKSDEAAKKLQDEIQCIKAQKVQLQHKIKQEAEQFRQWKASREKELLQSSNGNGVNAQSNDKSLQRWLDHELEVMVNVHEVRFEYEKQSEVRAALAEELAVLRQVDEFASKGVSPPRGKNGLSRASSMSPNARMARIASLESMLSISSNSLVAMASQLSEAEERERSVSSRGRWNQLRSMGDAKTCSSICSIILAMQGKLTKHIADDTSGPLSPIPVPAQKQLKYTAGIANGSVRESTVFMDQTRKVNEELALVVGHGGKLWRWKRSHHQWLLQFKWKWQKPWRLSEWIRHSDETIMRARPRPQALPDVDVYVAVGQLLPIGYSYTGRQEHEVKWFLRPWNFVVVVAHRLHLMAWCNFEWCSLACVILRTAFSVVEILM
ncbi:UNVERIFIED_CONTAM: Kinesin-like protein KIN-4A [Sesamum angustifolium]|uniref:Kinesin-like protein n=1 Tax=Sesamum angustifolium TaxID=2727405 RepID=A0AAW2LB10_9LAMI